MAALRELARQCSSDCEELLASVDGFYHEKMSTALQIALTASEPLNLLIYAFQERELDVGPDYAMDMATAEVSDATFDQLRATIAKRLNGWCKGLLEVHGRTVHFLHRTVVDFLRTGGMADFLRSPNILPGCPNQPCSWSSMRNTAWRSFGQRATTFPPGLYDTLRCLLENGQDPNQEYREAGSPLACTPFSSLLSSAFQWDHILLEGTYTREALTIVRSQCLSLFLAFGADPNVLIYRSGGHAPPPTKLSTAWVELVPLAYRLGPYSGDAGPYLQELDTFLRYGRTDLQASRFYTVTSSGALAGDGTRAHQAFFSQLLLHQDQEGPAMGLVHAQVLGQVAKRLLWTIQDDPDELEKAWLPIHTGLPPAVAHRLKAEWRAALATRNTEQRKKRSHRRTDEKYERSSKRYKKRGDIIGPWRAR